MMVIAAEKQLQQDHAPAIFDHDVERQLARGQHLLTLRHREKSLTVQSIVASMELPSAPTILYFDVVITLGLDFKFGGPAVAKY